MLLYLFVILSFDVMEFCPGVTNPFDVEGFPLISHGGLLFENPPTSFQLQHDPLVISNSFRRIAYHYLGTRFTN